MGMLLGPVMGVIDRNRQADPCHDRQIDHIVADIGDMLGVDTRILQNTLERRQLVAMALKDQIDPEVLHPVADNLRAAAGDDRDAHTVILQHAHAVPIAGMERLVLFAMITEKQAAVGEHTIDVENDELDLLGLVEKMQHLGLAQSVNIMPSNRTATALTGSDHKVYSPRMDKGMHTKQVVRAVLPLTGLAVLCAGCASAPALAARLDFAAAIDSVHWWLEEASGQACRLRQDIPGYGIARFVQTGWQPLRLTVELQRTPAQPIKADLAVQPAPWQGELVGRRVCELTINPGQASIRVEGRPAVTLLNALEQGRVVALRQHPKDPAVAAVQVTLQPIGMRTKRRAFRQCQADLRQSLIANEQWQLLTEAQARSSQAAQDQDIVVNFDFDRAAIKPAAAQTLDQVAQRARQAGHTIVIRLAGHADARGALSYNERLSERRARAVARYLIKAGVAPRRLRLHWYGETRPAAQGDDAIAHAANRRVRIRFVPVDGSES